MRRVLTIAGSDSGAGAGIQADLKTFAAHHVYGTTAITAVTAQNTLGVTQVLAMPSDLVTAQIEAIVGDIGVDAAKTGMLWSERIVHAVAQALGAAAVPIVVDPVMVATSGARLLDPRAIAAYAAHLLPRASLITPNLDEAAVLLAAESVAPDQMRAAADALFQRFDAPVLLKGGHLRGDPVDVLRHAGGFVVWRHRRIAEVNTHGSGCMLSAAIAARLAHGDALEDACAHGLAFVHDALARARAITPLRLDVLQKIAPEARSHLSVQERGRVILIPVPDILFLRAELKYVTVRTVRGEHLIEESLSRLEEEFGTRFVRVHRSCLVARAQIEGFYKEAGEGEARWTVQLRGLAEKLPISRRQQHIVREIGRNAL